MLKNRLDPGATTSQPSCAINIIDMISGFQCAGCGEWNETTVDTSAGSKQSYVEDCQVCCKPNVLHVWWDASAGEYVIRAELE
jgi:cysteine-rich CPXCG protein